VVHIYTVHEPVDGPRDRLERGEQLVFVREGFSWAAALFTPFWMMAHRLWLALLGYLAVSAALLVLLAAMGLTVPAGRWVMIAVHLLVGFEADSIRRWTLRRRGYDIIGSVTGRNRAECERRFFEAWLPGQPYVSPSLPPPPAAAGTGGRLHVMALRPGR
jgi:hypothetical protein